MLLTRQTQFSVLGQLILDYRLLASNTLANITKDKLVVNTSDFPLLEQSQI
jgi:hypothetical protein